MPHCAPLMNEMNGKITDEGGDAMEPYQSPCEIEHNEIDSNLKEDELYEND